MSRKARYSLRRYPTEYSWHPLTRMAPSRNRRWGVGIQLEIQTAVEKATEEHANTLKRKRDEARANDQDKENQPKRPKLTMDDYRKLRGGVEKAARLSENGNADANTIS
jgi:hypothetical protein